MDLNAYFEPKAELKAELWHLCPLFFLLLPPFVASPTLSIPPQWVVLETESQLKCHADGFYPPPVSFSWTRDGRVIQSPYHVEGEQTPDGYYMAVGNLTLYPSREDQNVTFGCKVSHNGSYQELDFQLNITCKIEAYCITIKDLNDSSHLSCRTRKATSSNNMFSQFALYNDLIKPIMKPKYLSDSLSLLRSPFC